MGRAYEPLGALSTSRSALPAPLPAQGPDPTLGPFREHETDGRPGLAGGRTALAQVFSGTG